MAKIVVDKPFNFREGLKTTTYTASKDPQEVSEACAAHAVNVLKLARLPPDPKAKDVAPAAAE